MEHEKREGPPEEVRRRRRFPFRFTAVIALALGIGFVAWLLVDDSDEGGSAAPGANGPAITARAATPADLATLARSLDHPIYWAGRVPGRKYELTKTEAGRVYVRYLPTSVAIGNRNPNYLTIGTYPQTNAYEALQEAAREPRAVSRRLRGGALVVVNANRPRSVYFSFDQARFQVEVYDPRPRRARELVESGRIQIIR